MHLGFCAASAVIAAPSSPDCPPDALRCAQDLVAGDSPGCVGLPGLGVLARRDDRRGTARGDGVVALAGVESTICRDAGDLLVGWYLVQKFGQHGRVTDVAGGELGRPDFQ